MRWPSSETAHPKTGCVALTVGSFKLLLSSVQSTIPSTPYGILKLEFWRFLFCHGQPDPRPAFSAGKRRCGTSLPPPQRTGSPVCLGWILAAWSCWSPPPDLFFPCPSVAWPGHGQHGPSCPVSTAPAGRSNLRFMFCQSTPSSR